MKYLFLFLNSLFMMSCAEDLLVNKSPASEQNQEDDTDTTPPTPATIKYMYQTDIKYALNEIGSREETSLNCQDTYNDNNNVWNLDCDNFVSFLGYSTDSGVQDLPNKYNVPNNGEVKSVDLEDTFADSFTGLITKGSSINGPQNALTQEGFKTDIRVWTAIDSDGSLKNNCNDWSNFDTSQMATSAQISYQNASPYRYKIYWASSTSSCKYAFENKSAYPHLCLCWKQNE